MIHSNPCATVISQHIAFCHAAQISPYQSHGITWPTVAYCIIPMTEDSKFCVLFPSTPETRGTR